MRRSIRFSIRLPVDLNDWLIDEAIRTARTKSAIVMIGIELVRASEIVPPKVPRTVSKHLQISLDNEAVSWLAEASVRLNVTKTQIIVCGLNLIKNGNR